MIAHKIEKGLPVLNGDPQEDVKALADYLNYLREEINFILTLLYKQMDA